MYIRSFYSTRFSFFVKKLKLCLFQWSCISLTRIEKRNKETPQCSKKYIPLSPPWFFRVLKELIKNGAILYQLMTEISNVTLFCLISLKPTFIQPNLARKVNNQWRNLKWGMVCPCSFNSSGRMQYLN